MVKYLPEHFIAGHDGLSIEVNSVEQHLRICDLLTLRVFRKNFENRLYIHLGLGYVIQHTEETTQKIDYN